MRFFDVMEFQRHMHTHAVMQQKSQEDDTLLEKSSTVPESVTSEREVKVESTNDDMKVNDDAVEQLEESGLQIDEEDDDILNSEQKNIDDQVQRSPSNKALDLTSPAPSDGQEVIMKHDSPRSDFGNISNMDPCNTMQINDERPQLNRSRSRESICKMCDKSFACNSALEV